MAVDLGRLDARPVLAVDLPDPGHAGDGIQAEVDELGVLIDIVDAHLQLGREQRFQEVRGILRCDRIGRCGHAGRNLHGLHGFHGLRGFHGGRGLGIGQEMPHYALQRMSLADETPVVHRQFARIGRFDRRALRCAEEPLQRARIFDAARGDRVGQRQRARHEFTARTAGVRKAFGAEFAAGVFGGDEQRFLREIQTKSRRENQGGAGAGRETVLHVRTDVAAFRAEQADIREHAQRPAAADGMALHCGDDRQLAVHRQLIDLRVGEFRDALLDRQQAFAGAAAGEIRVVAGEHDGAVVVGRFDVREDFFQAADQFGRVHVLRVAVNHAHDHHAVVAHFGLDRGRRRHGRRPGAAHAGAISRSAVDIGIGGDVCIAIRQGGRVGKAPPPPPLIQGDRRPQRRCFGKRQRGRQHVARIAANDDARARRKPVGGYGGRIEQALVRHVVAEAAREQRHRLAQQCGIAPERIGRAAAVLAVHAGVGAQAQQPADAIHVAFECDDDRNRKFRERRLQRRQRGDALRIVRTLRCVRRDGIRRQGRQKAGTIAAQHHRGVIARRQFAQRRIQMREQHRQRRVACAEADRNDGVGQHVDCDALSRLLARFIARFVA